MRYARHPEWDYWPNKLKFRRPSIKPVMGGRWFVRKCPPEWISRVASGHPDRLWKAYNDSKRHKSRWFATQLEAFEYCLKMYHQHQIDLAFKRSLGLADD